MLKSDDDDDDELCSQSSKSAQTFPTCKILPNSVYFSAYLKRIA